jgi:hypothetical protein
MKRGTIEHPKLAALASMLTVRRHVAVGILEMLWQHTARYAPRGDIGKYKDCQIAAALDWPNDDATRLVRCLIDCGWLDENQEFRLIVHDWHDHSSSTCDKYLRDNGLTYATSHDTRLKLRDLTDKSTTSHDKSRQVTTSHATRARGQNQNQNQNQNQSSDHPQFARLIEAGKGHLDDVTWESWKILLHGRGLDGPECGLTEAQVVTNLLPLIETAAWSMVERQGTARWLGWQLDDMGKRMVLKKNSAQKESVEVAAPSRRFDGEFTV